MTAMRAGRRRAVAAVAAAALFALAACAPAASEAAQGRAGENAETSSAHPRSGLPVIPLTITSGGRQQDFRVEYARSDADQAKGLMFRTELGPDEGMLFHDGVVRERSFWMKNTVIPLDIIFIGADMRIRNIIAEALPYSLDSLPSDGPVLAVLELAGGRAAALGLSPGDEVQFVAPDQSGAANAAGAR